ncbi:unnamed protein product [Moneuplotes crassus]|uniref:Uncharacterized protein n=1 Tax=Euplotes crassus TaxID=5936 RepID=A0AAD1U1I8_EUPCR|nr:unnamed protein product [Moneuplotes crassus]
MNATYKTQSKVFLPVAVMKDNEDFEDCDISDEVLSEASSKVTNHKRVHCKKSKFKCSSKSMCHTKLCQNMLQTSFNIRESDECILEKSSNFEENIIKSKSEHESSERFPTSLKSEIRSLLQKLIQQKKQIKKSKAPLDSMREPPLFREQVPSVVQGSCNFDLTMGDVHTPEQLEDIQLF